MSRKWMAWVLVPAMMVVLWGCPKKQPKTPPKEIKVETQKVTPPPAQEVKPAPEMTKEDQTQPQLPKDVEELNQYLRDQKLIEDVYFDFDKSDLRPEAQESLAKNADWLKSHPGYVARIEGNCDERGTNEYNLALGQRRASAAADYLASLGVAPDRLTTVSYGEERPVCTESTEACWQRNRRDHFVIRPK